jgi:hypothetical protein
MSEATSGTNGPALARGSVAPSNSTSGVSAIIFSPLNLIRRTLEIDAATDARLSEMAAEPVGRISEA